MTAITGRCNYFYLEHDAGFCSESDHLLRTSEKVDVPQGDMHAEMRRAARDPQRLSHFPQSNPGPWTTTGNPPSPVHLIEARGIERT
jgi:hypothetical protein